MKTEFLKNVRIILKRKTELHFSYRNCGRTLRDIWLTTLKNLLVCFLGIVSPLSLSAFLKFFCRMTLLMMISWSLTRVIKCSFGWALAAPKWKSSLVTNLHKSIFRTCAQNNQKKLGNSFWQSWAKNPNGSPDASMDGLHLH